jgi:hypothetical protein
MPGTGFVGTDPANELPPGVPGEAAPGELGPGAVGTGVCASVIGEQGHRTPANRNVHPKWQMILKATSFAQSPLTRGANILFPLAIPNNGYLLRERWMLCKQQERQTSLIPTVQTSASW